MPTREHGRPESADIPGAAWMTPRFRELHRSLATWGILAVASGGLAVALYGFAKHKLFQWDYWPGNSLWRFTGIAFAYAVFCAVVWLRPALRAITAAFFPF